jgi:hypothetical protein
MNRRFAIASHVRWTEASAGYVTILDSESGVYLNLNATGSAIWLGLASGDSISDVANSICRRFLVDLAEAEKDSARLVDQLLARNLIVDLGEMVPERRS